MDRTKFFFPNASCFGDSLLCLFRTCIEQGVLNGLVVALWSTVLGRMLTLYLVSTGSDTAIDWLSLIPCVEGGTACMPQTGHSWSRYGPCMNQCSLKAELNMYIFSAPTVKCSRISLWQHSFYSYLCTLVLEIYIYKKHRGKISDSNTSEYRCPCRPPHDVILHRVSAVFRYSIPRNNNKQK